MSFNAETIQKLLKKSNLGPKNDKMTYTRDIIVVALSFGKKTIPDLPCKDWWTLAFIVENFLKKPNLGPKIDKMTYTRDIIVVALSFGKKTIPDLPCKDWWTLAFIVGNAFHYARGGHSWLGSTNGTRLDRACLIVPAKKKKMKKIVKISRVTKADIRLHWLTDFPFLSDCC